MVHKVIVTPIIGLPRVNGWAQTIESPNTGFVCSFSVEGSQAGNVGRDLVDLVQVTTVDSATSIYSFIKKLIRSTQEKNCKLQCVCGLFGENSGVFAAYQGSMLLERGEKIGVILTAFDKVKVIEGKRMDGDVFVLMTKQALSYKEEIIQKLSQGLDADTTVASVVPGVQNTSDSSLVAMAFITDQSQQNGQLQSIKREKSSQFSGYKSGGVSIKIESEDQSSSKILELEVENQKKVSIDFKKYLKIAFNLFLKLIRFIFRSVKLLFLPIKKLFSKDVYVDGQVDYQNGVKKKLTRVSIMVGVVIVFITISWWYVFSRSKKLTQSISTSINTSLLKLDEAKTFVDTDPIKSRSLTKEAIEQLKTQQKVYSKNKKAVRIIEAEIEKADRFYSQISGEQELNKLDVFFDFRLVESDFVGSVVAISKDKALFLDSGKREIIQLNLKTKSFSQLSLQDLEKTKYIAAGEGYILILGNGVSQLSLVEDETAQKIILDGLANRDGKFLSFYGSSIYVFNPGQRNIFKYSQSEDKYNDPVRWIKSAIDLEYDQVTSMAIDGDIWLATRKGEVFQLTGGRSQEFKVVGLIDPFSSSLILYTDDRQENLFILEPEKSRLVILNKKGEFLKEIKSVSLLSANSLIISKDLNKALVVSGSIVFEVGL